MRLRNWSAALAASSSAIAVRVGCLIATNVTTNVATLVVNPPFSCATWLLHRQIGGLVCTSHGNHEESEDREIFQQLVCLLVIIASVEIRIQ